MNTQQCEMLKATARLWLDPNQRDVAEIRFDDLLNPTGENAIVSIEEGLFGGVVIILEDGVQHFVAGV